MIPDRVTQDGGIPAHPDEHTQAEHGSTVHRLLPHPAPVRLLDENGQRVDAHPDYPLPPAADLLAAYRAMVIGRRFDRQACVLALQGRIAAFPSSEGQEACQVGAAQALASTDWLFPTYRDSTALLTRGIDPIDVLAPVRGRVHCGYDPYDHRCAPMTTPLATQALHAVGLAAAAARDHKPTVALALVGDGATSEGDFHEALNFAAVFRAPVVLLVQNNRYAISVPLARQSAAPALAYKGVGYGVRAEQVDGNDVAAVLAVLRVAVERARGGDGPMLVEAHTYRLAAHTTADDPSRYRDPAETARWRTRDPLVRLRTYLRTAGLLDDHDDDAISAQAEELATGVRAGVGEPAAGGPADLFTHVYAQPPATLAEQRHEAEQAAFARLDVTTQPAAGVTSGRGTSR
ncbi:thiamine pyrophosphate-dependent enzyme [Frankia sp. AgPm24]|nr:thiamine pyrophosphate-dependent enzyme [Frankia sp. AgPm24]